jgi:general secretion pathway protein I
VKTVPRGLSRLWRSPIAGSKTSEFPAASAGDAGFTIVEVVAALAILSLSLTLLFSTMSDGIHRQQRAKTLTEASALAQSLLARVGTELPLTPGAAKGDFANGFRWQIQVTPFGNASDAQEWPVAAYKVAVMVFAPSRSEQTAASLTTIRLAPKGGVK